MYATRDEYRLWYGTAKWRRLSKWKKAVNPLCEYCQQAGWITKTEVVDHIVPHKGDINLFYDSSNLRSSCKRCHDSIAKKKDKQGFAPGVGKDGVPLDSEHPWHKGGRGKS